MNELKFELQNELEFLEDLHKKLATAKGLITDEWDKAGLAFLDGAIEGRIIIIKGRIKDVEADELSRN